MRCPYCEQEDTRVIDSRPSDRGRAVRRRRRCHSCGERFTTYERPATPLVVLKRQGGREPFDLDKVRSGLDRALGGRPLPPGAVDSIIQRVEAAAQEGTEIASDEIGRIILEGLKEIDEVAYLRFASVYKDFEGAQDFERELAALDD